MSFKPDDETHEDLTENLLENILLELTKIRILLENEFQENTDDIVRSE